jgi:hypothetical protein
MVMGEPHARGHQEELAPGEGRRCTTRGNLECGGHAGGRLCQHLKHLQEYYPVLRLSLNLLKCLYSHCICLPKTGITLFIDQRGYVHSEPPIVICTVIIVDIPAR